MEGKGVHSVCTYRPHVIGRYDCHCVQLSSKPVEVVRAGDDAAAHDTAGGARIGGRAGYGWGA